MRPWFTARRGTLFTTEAAPQAPGTAQAPPSRAGAIAITYASSPAMLAWSGSGTQGPSFFFVDQTTSQYQIRTQAETERTSSTIDTRDPLLDSRDSELSCPIRYGVGQNVPDTSQ